MRGTTPPDSLSYAPQLKAHRTTILAMICSSRQEASFVQLFVGVGLCARLAVDPIAIASDAPVATISAAASVPSRSELRFAEIAALKSERAGLGRLLRSPPTSLTCAFGLGASAYRL